MRSINDFLGGLKNDACKNPHDYCGDGLHIKEACTDYGQGWKDWMEENCPEICGLCGGRK